MGVLWHKVWFDLWHNKTRTLLAVLSVAAGAFAVGSIFGMSDLLGTTVDRSHQSVMPPHITVELDQPVDRDTLLNLESVAGVEGIEPYNAIGVQYKLHAQDQWRRGILETRDYNEMKYELVQLRQGRWPAGKDDIGIERMAAKYDELGLGSPIILKVGNDERNFRFSSLVRHPFVPPPQFEDLPFFFMSGPGMARFGIPDGKFNSFYVRVTPYSPDHAKEVATAIKDKLTRQDIGVLSFTYQDPYRHWGRSILDSFVLVQEALALVCVLMSVVLVYNTLTNLITQQNDQIGILKAIGARRSTIIGVYLTGALIYGMLALVIAVPVSAAVAFLVTRYFLNFFNIDYSQFQVSTGAVVFQVLCALAAPLLAGLPAVLQGARITVRDALASYGLGGYGSNWLDRLVEKMALHWLPSQYAAALGNMLRHKGRLLMTEFVLITAGVAFLSVMSLYTSINLTLDRVFARSRYDTVIQFSGNERLEHVKALTNSLPGIAKAELHLVQPASMYIAGQLVKEAGIGTRIEGIPADSDFFEPLIVAGRWLEPNDGQAVVVTRDTANKNGIQIGDTVTLDLGELGTDQWQVVGLYDPVFGGIVSGDKIYAPADALYQATKKYNEGNRLLLRTSAHGEQFTEDLTAKAKDLLDQRGLKVDDTQTQIALRKNNSFQFGIEIDMMLALAVIVAVVGSIALMGTLSIGVIERTKEIGVLRAVGAASKMVLGIFVMEGILQGLVSWVLAVPISLLTSPLLAEALGKTLFGATLDYQYNLWAVGLWLVIMLVISALASLVPANNATRISVRDSLAYA